MARKRTVGYVENEWTCPNCNSRNKGSIKTCENCGSPQPENVQFELSDQKLVTDSEKIKAAKAGADIHCGYCGARNPSNAETCSQCGGDLKEGKARESGRVMQAPPPTLETVTCKNCGTQNPGSASVCSNCGSPIARPQVVQAQAAMPTPVARDGQTPAAPMTGKTGKRSFLTMGLIGACIAFLCLGGVVWFVLTQISVSSVQGTVTNVYWETNVPVEEEVAVRHNDEQGSAPSGAYDVSCHTEESCTQKTVDKGNGYSEVVEECDDVNYCSYTLDEWKTVKTYTLEGNDLRPIYDDPSLASDQRVGNKTEDLVVTFSTENGELTYSPGTITEYQQFDIGSTWTLNLSLVGSVTSVE